MCVDRNMRIENVMSLMLFKSRNARYFVLKIKKNNVLENLWNLKIVNNLPKVFINCRNLDFL